MWPPSKHKSCSSPFQFRPKLKRTFDIKITIDWQSNACFTAGDLTQLAFFHKLVWDLFHGSDWRLAKSGWKPEYWTINLEFLAVGILSHFFWENAAKIFQIGHLTFSHRYYNGKYTQANQQKKRVVAGFDRRSFLVFCVSSTVSWLVWLFVNLSSTTFCTNYGSVLAL